jgi:hypothetical protein
VQHFSDPRAVADNQQVGTVGLADEHRTSRSADHPLPYGDAFYPVGHPRQCSRHDLGEFPPGPRLLGFWQHRLGGDRRFPAPGHHRRPAADGIELGAGVLGVRQSPPQRRVAGRGAVDTNNHKLSTHLRLLAAEPPSNAMSC